eukprot:1765262-Pleurochrysis_carterae.AAC.1
MRRQGTRTIKAKAVTFNVRKLMADGMRRKRACTQRRAIAINAMWVADRRTHELKTLARRRPVNT